MGDTAKVPAWQAGGRGAIDVHHHYLPPFYLERALDSMVRIFAASDAVRQWTPARAVETMDAIGIERAILSLSTPGFEFGGSWDITPDQLGSMARRVNEYARQMVCDHPGRFSIFTALPLPDVDAALEEIEHGYSALGSVGVGLLSNYGSRHLGDPLFAPVFEELNRRQAIAYIHPTDLPCCRGLVPDVGDWAIEYPTDTARTIASLIWSGAFVKYPRVRFIFAHGGGVLPMLTTRLLRSYARFLERTAVENAEEMHRGAVAGLARIFVDSASIADAPALAATLAWLDEERILFGSDHPFVPAPVMTGAIQDLGLSKETLAAIMRGNAESLFSFDA